MKKTTYVSYGVFVILFITSIQLFAQNYVPFTPRFNHDLKGDIVLVGNNILGPDNNAFNNGSVYNHNVNMQFIDIDLDPTTFNSSSADLDITNSNCYQIIHAGLYWSAVNVGTSPIDQVKFKGPTGAYHDVTGTVVFDSNGSSVDGGDSFPYACYADVTSIITGLTNNLGTYTVANVSSAEGRSRNIGNYTGHSAGWSLFIVYEDPTLTGKSITSFDGFSAISVAGGNPTLDIPVSGFRTVPAPTPVRANFAFATLEGDSPILGDRLRLNGSMLSTIDRPATNFFNSSVTQLSATPVNNRVPNSSNTLGFDTGVMVVPNPGNTVIANDATAATVRLETSGDTFFPYFFALAVDIIEPNIVLTKIVEDTSGNDISGQTVNLGDELNYVIGFQNTGNDDATNFTIRDILPLNIVFNYPTDIVSYPPGVSVQSYDPATREIIFRIDNSVVQVYDPMLEIRFRVSVVSNCSLLNDVCANSINNQAYATYSGTLNPTFTLSDDPSFNINSGCLITPQATNFLSDLNCEFREEVILCGDNVVLTSGSGYDTYSWSTDPSGTPVIGTGQSITVTNTGTYYVHNTAVAPCQSIDQIFDVITYGAGVPNPVIPFGDQVVICPNDGKELPNFFLCGANDSRNIETGITDTSSIIWERLDETSCSAVIDQDCANEDAACVWNQVATGPDYTIDTEGQYRLTLNYTGGCFNQYYFNVYENVLAPNVTTTDIICTTPGEIVVGGVPSGYEYSIDNVNYQLSNIISVNTAGIYTVYLRQIGVSPNPCIFEVPDVQIRERNFTVSTTITQPLCHGDLGNIVLAANDVRPQYFFSIYQGATLVNSVGPIAPNNYTFNNLSAGTYTVNVSTDDGCTYSEDIEIIEPPLLTATAALTQPLTCTNGEITIYPQGGTSPYFYFVNSTTVFQTIPTIDVSTADTYNITVVDSNNCSVDVSIDVDGIPQPDFNIGTTNILCADDVNGGGIAINVTNANGNTLRYSIDNGVTYSNSPVFSGLTTGTYNVIVEYTFGTDICFTVPQSVTITAATQIAGVATITTPYTCTSDGAITVSGVSGGTAPYMYSIDGLNFQSGTVFTGLTGGTYTVTIRDASNCTFDTAPVTIDSLDPPTDLDFSHTILSCPINITTVTVSATGGTGALQYRIVSPIFSSTSYQSSTNFLGLSPGTYTFRVRDANNCEYTETYTIPPLVPVSVDMVLTKELDCTTSPDAIIDGTVGGGNPPYTYTVSYNGSGFGSSTNITGSTFTYTTSSSGTYQFRVTDSRGCYNTSSVINVNSISNPSATNNITNPSCNGDNNGSTEIIPSGGEAPYTFSFNGSAFTSTTLYTGLSAGTYAYEVRDNNSCTFTGSVTLTEPNALQATTSITAFSCDVNNTSQSAIITINASTGGTTPYQYSFNGSSYSAANTLNVNDTGSNQTITWSVRDAQGCIVNGSETITTLNPPTDLSFSSSTVTCLATTSDVTLTTTNGDGVLTYTIEAPASATSNVTGASSGVFTGLLPDTYIFRVTDANGCFYEESYSIAPVTPIAVTGLKLTDVLCNGGNTGSIEFTISGNSGGYTYTLTGTGADVQSGNTVDYTNLVAGTYTINVTDSTTGCTDSATVIINEPTNPLSFTATSTSVFCSNDESQITVTPIGGTPSYTYAAVITGNPAPGVGAYSGSNVLIVDTNSATDLVWDVYVRDANDCITMNTVTIISDGLPTLDAIAQQCYVGGNLTITLSGTVSIGTAEYSMGSGYQSSPTFTITAPGTYTFTIRDDNNCTATQTLVVEPQLQLNAVLTKGIDCTASPDGSIMLTTIGGTGTYTYEVNYNGGGFIAIAGSPYTVTAAGTYVFRVTDSQGCEAESTVVVNPISNPTVSAISVDPTCNGDTNGTITLTASGGEAPYTYSIDGGVTFVSTNVFGGLGAGTYEYIVRDSNQCESASGISITLNNPDPIVGNVLSNPITCAPTAPGSFDVSVLTGGVAPYIYTLYDSSYTVLATYTETGVSPTATHSFGGLGFGDYHVTIVDANNCEYSYSGRIETPPYLDINGFVDSNNCATGVDYTVDTSGGTGPYTYSIFGQAPIDPPTLSTTYTYTGLLHGVTYFLQVEDVNGCISIHEAVMPAAPSGIEIVGTTSTDVSCFGSNNGTLNFTVQNYDATVTDINYQILDALTLTPVTALSTLTGPAGGPVSGNITGLPGGNYVLQATEATGTLCSATYTFTITQPIQVLDATANALPANCNVGAQVTVIATGGTGPYTYEAGAIGFITGTGEVLPTTNNVLILDDAIRLNWEILVTDANNCTYRFSQVITRDAEPTISPVVDQCFIGSDLTVTLVGTTFNGAATYSLDGITFQASPVFTISGSGTYTFTIRDDNGCTTTTSYTIQPQIQLNASLTKALDCTASPDGVIISIPNGGTGTYSTYEVSYNGGGFVVIGGSPYTATAPGTYEFRVTDSQGCQAISNIITVDPLIPLIAAETHVDVSCNGGSNGSITVTGSGGVGGYDYSIDNGVTFVSSNVFTGLNAAGSPYNVVIRDKNNCVSIAVPVTIDEPTIVGGSTTLTQGLSCGVGNSTQSAIVTVNGSGGTPPYMYSFDGGTNYSTNNTYTTNISGVVTVFVRDANGCISAALTETVPAITPPTDLDFASTVVTCLTTTSTVTLTTTDGVGALSYVILSPASATTNVTGATTGIFTGLTPDTYLFEVTDANSCTYQEAYTLNSEDNITVTGQLINDVVCNGSSNGAVTFTVGNFSGTYSYTVNGGPAVIGQTSLTIALTGLLIGNQTIIVTDDITGCTDTFTVSITEPSALTITEDSNINANCNLGAQVSVSASGGTEPYTYAFVEDGVAPTAGDYTNSNSRVLDYNININWDVYVQDANGCTELLDVIIDSDPLPTVTVPNLASNQCNLDGNPYTFTITGSTGIAPLTYSIGDGFQSSGTFTVNTAGTYTVTVRDANGCEATSPTTITVHPPINIIPDLTVLPTCNDDDGEITITGTGGSGTYNYSISPNPASIGLTGNVFSGVPSGTYTVTLIDAVTTCTIDAEIFVPEATPLTFTTTTTPVTCFGDNDGTIEMTINDYTGAYNYEVFDSSSASVFGVVSANTSTNPLIITGLLSDNYTITVTETDSPFCSTSLTNIAVGGPLSALTLVASETSNVTCDDNKGTITAVASGGWGTYEYELTGAATVAYSANSTFTDLSAGVYTVNVRDAGNCIASYNVILDLPTPIDATITATPSLLACFGDDNATITVSGVTGGQGTNYSYTLNMVSPTLSSSGPQSSTVFNNLGIGTYNVTVTDGYNCTFTTTNVVITDPTPVEATLVKVTSQTCTTDASLTLSAVGGTGTYEYSDTENFTSILGAFSTSTTFSVTPGDYMYYVRDANGCISVVSNQITIEPLPTLTLVLDTTNATVNCAGDTTGVIIATAQGGLGSYVYTLQDTSGNLITPVTQNSPGVFTELPVGNYQVHVDSGDCLETSETISITEPSLPLQVSLNTSDISCNGENNGIIEIIATGGTGVIKYAISPQMNQFFDEPVFEGLASGNYQVLVQDELGCYEVVDITINEPLPVMISVVPNSLIPELCDGDMNGEFSVEISGGTLPYNVALDDVNGTYVTGTSTQTIFDFTGLSGGDHVVYIIDAEGCESEWNIIFPESVLLDPEVSIDYCTDTADTSSNFVTVLIDDSVNATDVDYSLDGVNFQASNVFTDVASGVNRAITVRHTNGCEQTVFFDVNQYNPLEIALSDGNFNEIEAQASGGSGGYEYAIRRVSDIDFEPYGNTGTFSIYESGNYTVSVTDSNGCIATATRYFEYIDVCITNYFTPNGDNKLDEWGPGCTSQYKDLTFDIFDRYGRVVKTLRATEKWDGKYNGKELPTGDYWYVVKLNDPRDDRSFVGHFTLYR